MDIAYNGWTDAAGANFFGNHFYKWYTAYESGIFWRVMKILTFGPCSTFSPALFSSRLDLQYFGKVKKLLLIFLYQLHLDKVFHMICNLLRILFQELFCFMLIHFESILLYVGMTRSGQLWLGPASLARIWAFCFK